MSSATGNGRSNVKYNQLVKIPKCLRSPSPPSPDDYGPLVKVVVGTGKASKQFSVYKGLLTYYSSYFRTALTDKWVEGTTSAIHLPKDEPEVFRAFFHWLYARRLYTSTGPTRRDGIPFDFNFIAKIYVFGDARGIPEPCNAAVDLLIQKCLSEWLSCASDTITYVYDNTPENCALRRFMVTFTVDTADWTTYCTKSDKIPKEFFVDVLAEAYKRKMRLGFDVPDRQEYVKKTAKDICKYHDHSQTLPQE